LIKRRIIAMTDNNEQKIFPTETDLINLIYDTIATKEDSAVYLALLPQVAALVLANVLLQDDKFDPTGKTAVWLTKTRTGSATVAVDYNILEFVEACSRGGVVDMAPGECIVFDENSLTSANDVVH